MTTSSGFVSFTSVVLNLPSLHPDGSFSTQSSCFSFTPAGVSRLELRRKTAGEPQNFPQETEESRQHMQNTLDVITKRRLQLLWSPVPTLEHLVLVLSTGGAWELGSRTLLKGHYTWGCRGGSEVNSHLGLLPDPPPFPGWGTKALNMSQATRQWQEREGEGRRRKGHTQLTLLKNTS